MKNQYTLVATHLKLLLLVASFSTAWLVAQPQFVLVLSHCFTVHERAAVFGVASACAKMYPEAQATHLSASTRRIVQSFDVVSDADCANQQHSR